MKVNKSKDNEPAEQDGELTAQAQIHVADHELTVTQALTVLEKKKAKRELRKKLLKDSNWSWSKIIITALAAVTVAVISSRLTTVVNSLLLVALVSVLSAIVNEAYRVISVLASFGAKKVAAPIMGNGDDEVLPSGDTNESSDPLDAEIDQLEKALFKAKLKKNLPEGSELSLDDEHESNSKRDDSKDSVGYSEADKDIRTLAIHVITEAIKHPELSSPHEAIAASTPTSLEGSSKSHFVDYANKNIFQKIWAFIGANGNLKLIILFTLVALLSVGVSYGINSQIERVNYTTKVENSIVQMSDDEKEEIINQAVREAVEESVRTSVREALESDAEYGESLNGLTLEVDALRVQLDSLSSMVELKGSMTTDELINRELSNAKATLTDMSSKVGELEKANVTLNARIAELDNRISALERAKP